MTHQKNNRVFVILIIVISIILIGITIYNSTKNNTNLSESSDNLPEPASIEVQTLIELQRDKWPSAILEIDCLTESTTDAKQYCIDSQEILKKIYNK